MHLFVKPPEQPVEQAVRIGSLAPRSAPAMSGRLADRVIASAVEVTLDASDGSVHRAAGVGARAEELRHSSVRYVLDENASDWCGAIVRSADAFLSADNPLLRVPLESFWLEWRESGQARHRLGALVLASTDGRSGEITGYWERDDGQADLAILTVHFDLDNRISGSADQGEGFSFRKAEIPGLDSLFRHAVAVLAPGWAGYLRSTHGPAYREVIATCMKMVWFLLPQVLAFSTLLQSRTPPAVVPADLERLNRRRRKRGRAELLDHVEVRLDLGGSRARQSCGLGGSRLRTFPRQHHVCGHVVTRNGVTFWRAPHLRGDPAIPALLRTVLIGRSSGP